MNTVRVRAERGLIKVPDVRKIRFRMRGRQTEKARVNIDRLPATAYRRACQTIDAINVQIKIKKR